MTPIEIIGKGKSTIRVVWDEGEENEYSARELRQKCRCAHCIEEMTGRQLLDINSVAEDLHVVDIRLVGAYGIQITFSDKHNTGIYKFRDLHAQGSAAK